MLDLFVFSLTAAMLGIAYYLISNKLLRLIIFLLIPISFSFIVGNRDINAGFDTSKYVSGFQLTEGENLLDIPTIIKEKLGIGNEPLFWGVVWSISLLTNDPNKFLLLLAVISSVTLIFSLRVVNSQYCVVIFLLIAVSGTFINLFGNAVRQGLAIPFGILAIYYFLVLKDKKYGMLFSVLTFGFHYSSGVILMMALLVAKVRIKILYTLPFIGIVFSIILPSLLQHVTWIPLQYVVINEMEIFNPAIVLSFVSLCYFIYIANRPCFSSRSIVRKSRHLLFDGFLRFYLVILGMELMLIFNVFAFNRVAILGYIVQPILLGLSIMAFKDKGGILLIMTLLSLIWSFIILSSTPVIETLS